uniref:Uncharacterized protein n=1 Tax=Schistocephalus solidus TaxID=70667 RepID=A0A0X3NGP6_SCHSO
MLLNGEKRVIAKHASGRPSFSRNSLGGLSKLKVLWLCVLLYFILRISKEFLIPMAESHFIRCLYKLNAPLTCLFKGLNYIRALHDLTYCQQRYYLKIKIHVSAMSYRCLTQL